VPHARDPDWPVEAGQTPVPRRRPAGPLTAARERLEAAVCETVFRHQLQHPLADAPQPRRYYVARQGRDPDAALVRRLQDLTLSVQPLSQCRVTAREGVVDRATGARGVIVQVARLTWGHAAAVDVVGGYYLTHRQAASFRYHVAHDGHRWAVTTVHLLWRV
jgi:hypothetical protein